MSTVRWIGNAQTTAEVDTFTPANVGIGNTFTVTCNGKALTFTATANTVANVTAGLAALLDATKEPEFGEADWADETTLLQATVGEAGKPVTFTSSAAGGTATLTHAVATVNNSPNDANTAKNYDGGAVPVNSDDLVIDAGSVNMLYSLSALSTVLLTSLTRRRTYTGAIGLPEYTKTGYFEYRATEFTIKSTTTLIEQASQDAVGGVKLNNGSAQTALTVVGQGVTGLGFEQMCWRGTHASNTVNVTNGSLSVANADGQVATIATLQVQSGVVRCGSGTTLTTIAADNSIIEINSAATTVTMTGQQSQLWAKKAAAITTLKAYGGTVYWLSSGGITTLTVGAGATVDFSQLGAGITITNAVVMLAGSALLDPKGLVTFSAGILLSNCKLADVKIDVGTNRTITPS